jgi:hypothetical protein
MLHNIQKLRWLRLIAYLALCLGLVACGTNTPQQATSEALRGTQQARLNMAVDTYQTPTLPVMIPTIDLNKTPQAITRPDFNAAWLQGDPCAPPCWQGITPNETRLEDALELLNQLPFVKKIEQHGGENIFIWFTTDTLSYSGSLSFQKEPPYTIERIHLSVKPVQLGEIIAAYGEPSYVSVSTERVLIPEGGPGSDPYFYRFKILYVEQGFMISYSDFTPIDYIGAEQMLESMVLFGNSSQVPLDEDLKQIWDGTLIPWQGYQTFEFYCKQVRTTINSYNECPYYALTRTPQPENP